MIVSRCLIVLSACWFFAFPALAEKRVALVIGNAAYKHAPALANPKNDAEAMAAALRRLKFEVLFGVDLDEAATKRLLRDFAEKLDGFGKEDVAVLFYAGHGLQVSGRNYLVPVDAKLERERDLDFQAVSFEFVQSLMEKTPQTNIVILDSCRDNPLARTLARGMGVRSAGIGRGLAEMRGINDTLIVYATSPGNVALDGQGRHSPFTDALLKHVEQPGLEVRHMISQVRAAVIAATKGQQVPWEAASLTRQVYFAAAPALRETPAPAPEAPTPPAPPATPPPSTADNEALFWQSIKDSKNAADYKAYLEKYPNGTFASLAKLRIAEIEKAASVTPPAPAPEAVPQPRPTAPPVRNSTFVQNQWLNGSQIRVDRATSPQACASRCIHEAKCVAWRYLPEIAGLTALSQTCALLSTVTDKYDRRDISVTSGIIRTTPAAAPAQPAAPKPPTKTDTATAAPADQQALVRELMRKGQAREAENGFCAKVTWPLRNVWSNSEFVPLVPASGGIVLTKLAVGTKISSCSVRRISGIAKEGGQKTRTMEVWGCLSGERCFAQRLTMVERNGGWEHQQ